jgi:hypothetical protein
MNNHKRIFKYKLNILIDMDSQRKEFLLFNENLHLIKSYDSSFLIRKLQ